MLLKEPLGAGDGIINVTGQICACGFRLQQLLHIAQPLLDDQQLRRGFLYKLHDILNISQHTVGNIAVQSRSRHGFTEFIECCEKLSQLWIVRLRHTEVVDRLVAPDKAALNIDIAADIRPAARIDFFLFTLHVVASLYVNLAAKVLRNSAAVVDDRTS